MAKRKASKEARTLKKALLLIKNSMDAKEAYKELTGNDDDSNAQANANKIYTPEVLDAVKNLLGTEEIIKNNKVAITQFIQLVLARYISYRENGNVVVAALRLLKDIDPELSKNKIELDDVSKLSEKELDEELKKYKRFLTN